jgi:exoribonuclease R
MTMKKVIINNRDYSSWSMVDVNTNIQLSSSESNENGIIQNKWFHQDIVDETKNTIVHSTVRSLPYMSGVLILDGNKTYGRTTNRKRLLYKCVPNDKNLPHFLIPYEISIGFKKVHKNKYVIFKFQEWNDTQQHPIGILVETIGNVDILECFYEYQLYSKSLHHSIKNITNITKEITNKTPVEDYIKQILHNPKYQIQNRLENTPPIFTIDPLNSVDFDDGFSIQENVVTVYLANVYFWLETFQLWEGLSNRVSTIYLPDKRRPMLPTILSDSLCSLQQGQSRFAFAIDFTIIENNGIVVIDDTKTKMQNVIIRPHKNYVYEDHKMLYQDIHYNKLFKISSSIDKHQNNTIKNSHDLVAFWMIQTNKYMAEYMLKQQRGIFRVGKTISLFKEEEQLYHLKEDTQRLIQSWNNVVGQYILYNQEDSTQFEHCILKTKSYMHITSPIRRLVDLLNQMMLIGHLCPTSLSHKAIEFIDKWSGRMEYINYTMRNIRKVQTDCYALQMCVNNTDIMNEIHDGIVFDKSENSGVFSYMVYLENIKLLTRIKLTEICVENYSIHKFKIFLFEKEDNTKRKVRVSFI